MTTPEAFEHELTSLLAHTVLTAISTKQQLIALSDRLNASELPVAKALRAHIWADAEYVRVFEPGIPTYSSIGDMTDEQAAAAITAIKARYTPAEEAR
jgi:hypothetical protein